MLYVDGKMARGTSAVVDGENHRTEGGAAL